MNIALTMCAPSNEYLDWHSINWKQVHRNVKKLQLRIAKARSRRPKALALGRLLTSSFSAKALAVRRVTENRGKKTAGVDFETWSTPKQKAIALSRLRKHGYKPKPLRRIYIPKASSRKELRPLSIPCMIDRAMQSLHLLALEPIAETTADKNSYGFRPMRSTADAIEQCFNVLCRKSSAQYILKADIKACFDTISHSWLEANIPMDKRILKQWLKAGFMDKGQYYDTATGLAQGSPIAPIIMHMTLDGLETLLAKTFRPIRKLGKQLNPQVNVCRYADDFIATGRSKEILMEVKIVIEDFLALRGLELSKTKTQISLIEEGFDFLGQNLRKFKGKLLIQAAKKNVNAFLTKLRQLIKLHKQSTQAELIKKLNPVIKGWTTYHQHCCASKSFSKLGLLIWKMLWRWAKRRHPNKSAAWLKQRYFFKRTKTSWDFSCLIEDSSNPSGKRRLSLNQASSTPIIRHIKLKAQANPFDPAWETYFEQRLKKMMLSRLKGRHQLLAIWKRQTGKCLICKQVITKQTSWHLHHLIPKAKGGTNTQANLVLLHPNCHRQVHNNLDLSVRLLALTKEGS